ncbi:unnamed protein product [Periconia digitata]|uniref:Uncharacterized protein n=1 Tax=Periconia digitata TaxID=1303443 RepID=A0A9W4XQ62_9PLEO|nr:unnamed protein product [Periconia digitata]
MMMTMKNFLLIRSSDFSSLLLGIPAAKKRTELNRNYTIYNGLMRCVGTRV